MKNSVESASTQRPKLFPSYSRVLEVPIIVITFICVLLRLDTSTVDLKVTAVYVCVLAYITVIVISDLKNNIQSRTTVVLNARNSSGLCCALLVPMAVVICIGQDGSGHVIDGTVNLPSFMNPVFELVLVSIPVTGLESLSNVLIVCCSTALVYSTSAGILWLMFVSVLSSYSSYKLQEILLSSFPNSFSSAESCIIVQLVNLGIIRIIKKIVSVQYLLVPLAHSEEIQLAFFVAVIFFTMLLILPIFSSTKFKKYPKAFYLICGSVGVSVHPLLMVLLREEPFVWILSYTFHNWKRSALLMWWSICTVACILLVTLFDRGDHSCTRASTIVRKYFHLLIIAVYVSGLFSDPIFLYLASVIAFTVLVLVEIMRLGQVPPIGNTLHEVYKFFKDDQDKGDLILTPLYLLVGMSLPLWLSSTALLESGHVSLHAGVLSLGIGDSAASIGGKWIGRHNWIERRKTIEGTVTAIVVQIVTVPLFMMCGVPGASLCFQTVNAIIFISLMEAFTFQIDNLVLPILMFSLLRL